MSEQSGCSNFAILNSLAASIDRMREAEWHIRMMEETYHSADEFRWSLNSFLRSLKEVVQLLAMEIQGQPEVVKWFRGEREVLSKQPLIRFMYKQRDSVVHKTMLTPASKGFVGFTRGRGLKLGINLPIDPRDDSEVAMLKYIDHAAKPGIGDFLGILYQEEDGGGEYSCVQRSWRHEDFPDEELIELAARAWESVADLTMKVATRLGAKVVPQKLELRDPNIVQFEIYKPAWIKAQFDEAKARIKAGG